LKIIGDELALLWRQIGLPVELQELGGKSWPARPSSIAMGEQPGGQRGGQAAELWAAEPMLWSRRAACLSIGGAQCKQQQWS